MSKNNSMASMRQIVVVAEVASPHPAFAYANETFSLGREKESTLPTII
jgi:hypothetical protein